MKKTFTKLGYSVIIIIASFSLFSDSIKAQVLVVPPSPGNLSTVEHLTQSNDFVVEVKKAADATYTTCFVYKTDNWASNSGGGEHRLQKAVSFTNVSFSGGAIDVRITTNFTANSVKVRPLNYNITPNRSGNVITFRLNSPKKLSVEVNDRLNPLFLFFDTPDVPNTGATYYYGPGVHNVGMKKAIQSNQSVYIAGGAVVEGTFMLAEGATNINFRGRGIISNGVLPTLEAQGGPSNATLFKNATISSATLYSSSCNHITFEGFIITNGAGWTFALPNYGHSSNHNSWRNIKEVEWSGCTDGIWFDGDDNTIDDCFIFNNDDAVTTHGSNNCTITNTTTWGGNWGHLFYHDDYGSSSGITMENINVIGQDACRELIWVMSRSGASNIVQNVTFRNVRIEEHISRSSYNVAKLIKFELNNNKVKNWLFEDFTVDDKNNDEGDIYGTANGTVDGISFCNLKMGGAYVKTLAQANMDKNSYATNITFCATTGVNKLSTANTFVIYPNPANDYIVIEGLNIDSKIELYDILGRKVFSQITNNSNTKIDVSEFNQGIFFLKVITQDGISDIGKFIKE
ncbi:MAG: T9SS type A sorting domain-containing protein [Bacteroidetes bacterium]|nr:T9SS type A sorting domain-containing protein [Bacteroidota bacterium]